MGTERIEERREDGLLLLRMVRGRGNALDEATLIELEERLRAADPKCSIVLGGTGRAFCTGLDLEECHARGRTAMRRTMRRFHRALETVFLHPAPVVAAVNGHALAGGALLALSCDRRLGARDAGRFGIHGVHLGVSYPQVAVEILRHQLPRRTLEDLLYAGHVYSEQAALDAGLLDRIVATEELEREARAEALGLAVGGEQAFATAKSRLRSRAASRLRPMSVPLLERWLDQWFEPETQARIARARQALGGGGGPKPAA